VMFVPFTARSPAIQAASRPSARLEDVARQAASESVDSLFYFHFALEGSAESSSGLARLTKGLFRPVITCNPGGQPAERGGHLIEGQIEEAPQLGAARPQTHHKRKSSVFVFD
jgi:hypothetical protein